MNDYVSLYVFAWDKDYQDIKLLFLEKNNILTLPGSKISKVTAQDNKTEVNSATQKDSIKNDISSDAKVSEFYIVINIKIVKFNKR